MSGNGRAVSFPARTLIPPASLAMALAIRFGLLAPASTFDLLFAGVAVWQVAHEKTDPGIAL